MSAFDSPGFKKLQAEWYEKLKTAEFNDIENHKGDLTDHQTAYDFSQRIAFKTDLIEYTANYFSWASEMVHHGRFLCKTDHKIWFLHSEGHSHRHICAIIGVTHRWVGRKIIRIREYLRDQESEA